MEGMAAATFLKRKRHFVISELPDEHFNQDSVWRVITKAGFFLIATLGVMALSSNASGQIVGDYRSAATGNWNATATWERFDGTNWVAAVATPTSADGAITIRSPHVVTISASGLSYDQVVVDPGAQVTVAAAITHTLANGAGTDLTINGTWLNSGGAWTVTGATWTVGSGGTYVHNTTSGVGTPLGAATLNAASTFIFRGSSTLSPATSYSGRTYGNLSFESTSGSWADNGSGAGAFTVNGALEIGTGVTLNLGMTGGFNLKGNVSVSSGATLNFNPISAATVSFNGSNTQTISNAGALTFQSNQNVTINNGNGVTLNSPIALSGVVTLSSGKITTGSNTLTLGSSASISGSASSYVIGSLKKTAVPNGSFTFPVGTSNGYTPVDVANASGGGDLTVSPKTPQQPLLSPGTSLQEYWTLTKAGTLTTDLTFTYLQGDVAGNEGNYRVIVVDSGIATSFPADGVNVLVDTVNNSFSRKAVESFSDWTIAEPVSPTAANGSLGGVITDSNGKPLAGATINLSGAQTRQTISDSNGVYSFGNLETNGFYTVTPARANYNFSPASRSFSLLGAHTEASFTGLVNGVNVNPLDTTEFFVRQQYLDLLGREPDESGFDFWSNEIRSCRNDAGCVEARRINTSAAFFLSIEFQQTGYAIYRMYRAAYGDLPNSPSPLKFSEFLPDAQKLARGVVVGQSGWQQTLADNQRAFADDFVLRARFIAVYGPMSDAQYVDTLNRNAGGALTQLDRDHLVQDLSSGQTTRAQALRSVADNAVFKRAELNRAFVLMEYFGYLRRDPDQQPDSDFEGFNFWLKKLDHFDGNVVNAEMIKAFLVSSEYRQRFGP